MSNPLDDISSMVTSRIVAHTPNIRASVDAALHPDRLKTMVEASLKDLNGQVERLVAAKVARCIEEKLGLGSIDAKISALINFHIDAHVLDQYGC